MEEKYLFFWNGIYSNWYPCKFIVDGVEYNCSEQYMMHMKALICCDYETAADIMKSSSPKEQKALGRDIKNYDENLWKKLRYNTVKNGCRAKFEQNSDLKKQLLSNRGKEFVEASPYDRIWGIGFGEADALKNKEKWGENLLGKLLTELSNELS